MHVTIRVVPAVGRLRRRIAYRCVSDALLAGFPRDGFKVVAASVQATHLHLLIEAHDKHALSRGMQSFSISFARRLNRRCGRKGRVLSDRYHAEIITTPRQARNTYAYIFNNWRKHHEDRGRAWRIDPFSSAIAFDGWKGMESFAGFRLPPTYEVLPVHYPKSWLLKIGWRRYGRIDFYERPAPRPRHSRSHGPRVTDRERSPLRGRARGSVDPARPGTAPG